MTCARPKHWLGVALLVALYSCGGSEGSAASASSSGKAQAQPPASCGTKGQPDCPLQGWMKSTVQPYQKDKDYQRLARAFGDLAEHAPDGYGDWKAISEKGKAAAEARDDEAVRSSCKSCHSDYRERFRKERRGAPLFE